MANTALKPARLLFQPVRAYGSSANVSSDPSHHQSFAEAQSKAREWADRAIDLYHGGNTERTLHAARVAEAWLARMQTREPVGRSEPRSSVAPDGGASRTERVTHNSAAVPVRPLSAPVMPGAGPLVSNLIAPRKALHFKRNR